MRKVVDIMSTNVAIDIEGTNDSRVFSKVCDRLRQIEREYNPYDPNSLVFLFNGGEFKLKNSSTEFKKIYKECNRFNVKTDGLFSAFYSGQYNPSGYVKGWAISEASTIIKNLGFKNFFINIGGDILASSDGNKEWNVGLQDPNNKKSIFTKLTVKNMAIATSGSYERGEHIVNPISGIPSNELLSVTVYGKDIIEADVFATATYAKGSAYQLLPGYSAILVDKKGKIYQYKF